MIIYCKSASFRVQRMCMPDSNSNTRIALHLECCKKCNNNSRLLSTCCCWISRLRSLMSCNNTSKSSNCKGALPLCKSSRICEQNPQLQAIQDTQQLRQSKKYTEASTTHTPPYLVQLTQCLPLTSFCNSSGHLQCYGAACCSRCHACSNEQQAS